MASEAAEADHYRAKYPGLANYSDDGLVVRQGRAKDRHAEDVELVTEREQLYQSRPHQPRASESPESRITRFGTQFDQELSRIAREQGTDEAGMARVMGLTQEARARGEKPSPDAITEAMGSYQASRADSVAAFEGALRQQPQIQGTETEAQLRRSYLGESEQGGNEEAALDRALSVLERLEQQLADLEREYNSGR